MGASRPAASRLPSKESCVKKFSSSSSRPAATTAKSDKVLRAVPGVLAVALLLAATRWGAYVGASPLFLSDVFVALAVLHFLVAWLTGNAGSVGRGGSGTARWIIWAVLIFVVARAVAGERLSPVSLRDAAPYAYSALALLSGISVGRVTPSARERTSALLTWALNLHATWFIAATFLPLPTMMVGPNVAIFSLRDDIDAAVSGIAAALILIRLIRGEARRPFLGLSFLFAVFAAISFGPSRAGLLSALLVCVVALYIGYNSVQNNAARKRLILALGAPVVGFALILFMQSPVSVRLLALINPSLSGSSAEGARGTAEARQASWGVLSAWILSDPTRTWFGVGFGPDFLADSKANLVLLGMQADSSDVGAPRSPHNYWLGTLARLGLVGLSLILSAIAIGVVGVWRNLRYKVDDDLFLIGSLVVLGFLPVATLGVVLESPFGAIPFWWCLGIVLAGAAESRRSKTPPSGESIQ